MRERIFRATLLGRCLLASLSRKRIDAVVAPKKVIVVLTGKLGDMVCGTPVLRALRKAFPDTRIVVAGGKGIRALLDNSELADEYLDLEGDGALSRIRAMSADAALVTGPSFAPAALLYLGGIPLVVVPRVEGGYSPAAQTLPYKIFNRLVTTFPYKMGAYAPRERLRVLEPLGIVTEDTAKKLGYSSDASKKVDRLFSEKGINSKRDFLVGVSVTAGNKVKEWPEDRFAKLIDHLIEKRHVKVVLIGGPEDGERIKTTLAHSKNGGSVINMQGQLNLDELKAFMSRLNLFIAVDTGPIYIAEAFGVPTVDIVGPLNENEQPPRGPLHRSVVPPQPRKPVMSILNARDLNVEEARRQILSTSVEAVIEVTKNLIQDLQERGDVGYTEPSGYGK